MLIKCYANLKAVQMQNTNNDGWVGSVTFARTRKGPFVPGYCTTCNKKGPTLSMGLDGDASGGALGGVCHYGKKCDIAFDLGACTCNPPAHASARLERAPPMRISRTPL